VLALLREERLLPRGDLLDLFELERQEEEVHGRAADLESLDRLVKEGGAEKAAEAREEVEHAAEVAAARLRQKAQNMAQRLGEMPLRARAALPAAAAGVARQLAEASQESRSWGTGLGGGGRTSPGRQIELGRRLATNPKLRKLAAVVGRMRQQALALRKRPFERLSEEVFDVQLGRDLERLLPPELLALGHPLLRRDVAEYFPGGGTDFETPLTAALGCLGAARYRRGDIVLITDGECRVSPGWAAHFLAEKKRLQFSLFSVLIDVGPSSFDTLRELSDRVTSVSRLTDDAAADVFVRL